MRSLRTGNCGNNRHPTVQYMQLLQRQLPEPIDNCRRQVVDEETVDSPPLAGGALQRAPAPLPFSLGDGAMLDLSLKGGLIHPGVPLAG